ncbi:CBS domain-containing protein [soil metagenome]
MLRVCDVMASSPVSCAPTSTLCEAAKAMLMTDCGSLPVVDGDSTQLVGIITDRDIAIRGCAAGQDPNSTAVSVVMSHPVVSVVSDSPLEDCLKLMEANQIRRAPVVDHNGQLVGIVAQADIALKTSQEVSGELVKQISKEASVGLPS